MAGEAEDIRGHLPAKEVEGDPVRARGDGPLMAVEAEDVRGHQTAGEVEGDPRRPG